MRSILAGLVLFASFSTAAAEPIHLGRSPDLSPDGKWVAFSYLGDVWIVSSAGGTARPVTMHERHDTTPVFSPDGKSLAFASNRHGNYDVFVVPFEGGRPTRLTHDSADDFPTGWSHDGKELLFASTRDFDFPPRTELYAVDATGGEARHVSLHEAREGAWSPDGKALAYTRGPGTWYRKNYRGSSNDDIWLCDPDGMHSRQITTHLGNDNAPMWAPDGRFLYYVSDRFGVPNIVRQKIADDLSGPVGVPEQVTFHKDEGVRKARLGAGGKAFVYERGFDLYIHDLDTKKSRKLDIEAYADERGNPERVVSFTKDASEFSLSHDEKRIAFVVQGNIFLMPRTGGKAKQLTDAAAYDHGVTWAPDGKKLLFLSDRSGFEDIYALESDDPEHADLSAAHKFKVTQLTKTPEPEYGMEFSPDGKRVSFLRAGKLMTMKPDGTDEKPLAQDGHVFDYEWSPDGKWVCYARNDNSFASELFIIPSTGPTAENPARNITRFATYNGGITWSRTGNRIAFISRRRRDSSNAYVIALNKAGAASSKEFDWEGIHLRVKQPTTMETTSCSISSDGSKIAFRGGRGSEDDLWVASVDGGQTMRITAGSMGPSQLHWSRLFASQIYFRDSSGQIRTANTTVPAKTDSAQASEAPPRRGGFGAGATESSQQALVIPFIAKKTVRRDDQFAEIFEQSWRALEENFYDRHYHGVDWQKVRERYRPMLKHCALREDLYYLIYLMMGELNASHLGISGNMPASEQNTANLGLFFDPHFAGPGLKVTEILKGGPADRHESKVKVGDVIVAIDGTTLSRKVDVSDLLNDKAGETVELTIARDPADPKKTHRIETQAIGRTQAHQLCYERWIERNAAQVDKLSGGKLGYIHIPAMNEAGVERFLRALYDSFDKEGIVIDVRYNGGGNTHETILNYLLGKEHTKFSGRDGTEGFVLNSADRKWSRPLTLLINNRSYSDAEIFPNAFREYKLGKLVGQATGGHVIGTREIKLIDGTSFRTPRIGVTTSKGVNMERAGVIPDVAVDIHPDQLARGEDPQLEKAVEVLLEDVVARRARPSASPTPAVTQQPQPPLPMRKTETTPSRSGNSK
jgi:tricorn protease